jgi:hypothetical protein
MIKLTPQQDKKALALVLAVLFALILYRMVTTERPRTAPLAFPPGSVAHSSVRQRPVDASDADPLNVFFARHAEQYPGASRDLFKMENPAPKPKPAPVIVAPPPPPPPPQRTPEEIAADLSRADLAKFRFLGYLTAKDNTFFLSKDGELFIVKSGDNFHKNYQVKKATNDAVVLLDTATGVEMRIDLAGGEPQQQTQQQPQQRTQQPQQQQMQRSPLQPALQPSHQQQKAAPPQSTPQVSDEPAQQLPDEEQGPPARQLRRRIQKPAR